MAWEKKISREFRVAALLTALICGFSGASCNGPAVNSVTSTGGSGSGGGGSSTSSCPQNSSSTLIDAGLKGPINIYRGVYSDIKMLPGASSDTPLIAFSDGMNPAGAAATADQDLKFAWWNGTGFTTEVIAGDPFAEHVRLAVLSSGIPIVVWSQYLSATEAYLQVAIRSAAPPASGTWTVSTLDSTVTPNSTNKDMGPIEVSVSPSDDVLIAYGYANTTSTYHPKYAYCAGPCTGTFTTMSAGTYIDSTNTFNPALTQIGAAWCNNGSSYVPAVAYSMTSSTIRPVYAVCNNTEANCLSTANWSVYTGITTVSTAPTAVSLFLDPAVSGDTPRIATGRNGSGIYTYLGGSACSTTGAFTVSTTDIGPDTTAGGKWIKILKDSQSTPGYHIVSDDATASHSVGYFNQVAAGDPFSTAADWHAEGALESVAITASSGGGAAISTTSTNIFASYALGVAPFDLRMAAVGDYTVASNNTNAVFDHFDVDAGGALGMPGIFSTTSGAQRNAAVALTSKGVPGVAYIDFSYGGTNTTGRLKYAYEGATEQNGGWTVNLLGDTSSPQYPSIAFDADDHPWISYYDPTLVGYFLATNDYTDGSGPWTIYEFPVVPGTASALPSANETALAMYESGGTSYPVMTVIDSGGNPKAVKAAMLDPATGSWSGPTTEASHYEVSSTALTAGAAYLKTDYDSSGDIFAAYYDIGANKIDIAYSPSGAGWIAPVGFTPPGNVAGLSIRMDPTNGIPAVVWNDLTNNKLYFLQCSGSSAIACAVGGWSGTPTALDSGTALSGMTGQPTYGWEQLTQAALVYSRDGVPSVFYTHGPTDGIYGGNLLQLTYDGSGWPSSPTIVGPFDGISANANTTKSAGTAAANGINFGGLGWATVAAENSSGGTIAVSLGMGNSLYATSCGL